TWIMDGHNMIFAIPRLQGLQVSGHRDEARRALEDRLRRFAQRRGQKVLVVFDGNDLQRNDDGAGLPGSAGTGRCACSCRQASPVGPDRQEAGRVSRGGGDGRERPAKEGAGAPSPGTPTQAAPEARPALLTGGNKSSRCFASFSRLRLV
ncbi:MAG: NYN domain-containing protein, partial [Acidobacteria bacterium]|nr:NYN domain-containing protein [Acidobacteriota bacterium]